VFDHFDDGNGAIVGKMNDLSSPRSNVMTVYKRDRITVNGHAINFMSNVLSVTVVTGHWLPECHLSGTIGPIPHS
jgi:hypothetical protein